MAESAGEFTKALAAVRAGEGSAMDALMPLMYEELRALAVSFFANQPKQHLLQPTAVLHEAYLKLLGGASVDWQDRAHFFAVAARVMRQILADHARVKKTQKHGGDWQRITLSGLDATGKSDRDIDLVALDEALTKLSELDAEQGRVVELRFLAGLGTSEIAHAMKVSTRTVERLWFGARAWLRRELAATDDG